MIKLTPKIDTEEYDVLMLSLEKIDPEDLKKSDHEYTGWGKGENYPDYRSRVSSATIKNVIQHKNSN